MLSLLWAWVQFLAGELGFHKLHCVTGEKERCVCVCVCSFVFMFKDTENSREIPPVITKMLSFYHAQSKSPKSLMVRLQVLANLLGEVWGNR